MIKINVGPHTVDELGKWQGGVKKGVPNWVGLKSRSTQTGDFKNTSGKASNGVVERSPEYFKQGNNPATVWDGTGVPELTNISTEEVQ
jgi:hypothetical protein